MAEILLKNILLEQRKGFKVACAAIDEKMNGMFTAFMDTGCQYDDHRKFIDSIVTGETKSVKKSIDAELSGREDAADKADVIEALYSATMFYEVYIWKTIQGSNRTMLDPGVKTTNIAAIPDFGTMLVRIAEIQKYLLGLNA